MFTTTINAPLRQSSQKLCSNGVTLIESLCYGNFNNLNMQILVFIHQFCMRRFPATKKFFISFYSPKYEMLLILKKPESPYRLINFNTAKYLFTRDTICRVNYHLLKCMYLNNYRTREMWIIIREFVTKNWKWNRDTRVLTIKGSSATREFMKLWNIAEM